MLYDNGQIMEYLAELWSLGVQEPAIKRAIALTKGWRQREMTAPAGYFYAAQDADSFSSSQHIEPEEGAFYIWSHGELQSLLSEDALGSLAAAFTVSVVRNFDGHNVLQRRYPGPLGESSEQALATLFEARYGKPAAALTTFPAAEDNQAAKMVPWPGRIPAVTDTKMIVA